ncbi:hypothetical protein EPA93_32285 [Ktedonosporobacter rubrisoli]|uniref:Mannosyl-glycoprotein endo-beta-N-acetylglucosamidase-like domain-containing protein n=1 Tax=Ktedonosporobacter rubrisoli TaxID=2509675 RepID=A0A4P6JY86_KTERU|nr:glucosaminidase domain-containing protein [Ktedonosporobacter rubrisoli]QBD80400.1 hypothetical protein EPA93_32285 [Ktedonosporobacter rubrisoli]
MASGSSYSRKKPGLSRPLETSSRVPPRATRSLVSQVVVEEEEPETELALPNTEDLDPGFVYPMRAATTYASSRRITSELEFHPLERHIFWLRRWHVAAVIGVAFLAIFLSVSILQRPEGPQLVNYAGGKVYSIQVGGDLASSWQSNKPMPAKVPIPPHSGPYSVMSKPTITADFINRVLENYHSPAAGKGQALYDLGVHYGIDPAFALAFFMHESTFGTQGEARTTFSLGNLRCIPSRPCVDQDRGGYAQMKSWEDGFQAWYELIRNLYVAQWGLTTIEQIIPRYAPSADHNNEAAYIGSLKHALDTWHQGNLTP